MKTSILQNFQIQLAEYAEAEFSFSINYQSNATYYYPDECLITIHHGQSDVQKCISALHELGHCKQSESKLSQVATKAGYQSFIVAQEISAWEEGWTIYQSFNITIPELEKQYWKTAAECIASYILETTRYTKTQLTEIATSYLQVRPEDEI